MVVVNVVGWSPTALLHLCQPIQCFAVENNFIVLNIKTVSHRLLSDQLLKTITSWCYSNISKIHFSCYRLLFRIKCAYFCWL